MLLIHEYQDRISIQMKEITDDHYTHLVS